MHHFSASIFKKNRYIEKKNGLNKRKNRWKIGEQKKRKIGKNLSIICQGLVVTWLQ